MSERRKCERPGCGRSFTAQRSTAKYCSSSCRGLASLKRKRLEAVPDVDVDLEPASIIEDDYRKSHPSAGRQIHAAVEKVLLKAERDETPSGRVALSIARRLDHSGIENGSSIAALSKELDRVLEKALAGVQVESDEVNELEARRRAKAAQA